MDTFVQPCLLLFKKHIINHIDGIKPSVRFYYYSFDARNSDASAVDMS